MVLLLEDKGIPWVANCFVVGNTLKEAVVNEKRPSSRVARTDHLVEFGRSYV